MNSRHEMNEAVNTFLVTGEKFMSEMHLRQPRLTYIACGPFTKNKERIQKFKETGDLRYIYQNKLSKVRFQHDIVYGDFKDLTKRTDFDKILGDKGFNIAKIPKYDGYQRELALMVYNFFNKNTSAGVIKNENISNKELSKELNYLKSIITKL